MGSPLVVGWAKIRVADVENTALTTHKDPLNTYRHFRDKSHTDGFLNYLNSLTADLQYTIEYPSHDGSLPYMDILIHADKSISVYRKPTHTNFYVRYYSCAPSSSKDNVIRSLTRQAHILCSPNTNKKNWTVDTVYTTSLQNGHLPDRVKCIMDSVKQKN